MTQTARTTGDAWRITAAYCFYPYTLRSAPAVMVSQLSDAFGLSTIVLKKTGAAARAQAPVVEETP